MLSTTEESRPQDTDAMTVQQLTKEVAFMKKQYNTMHNAVQSLSSQVMKLNRDVRALSQKKNLY
jgi:flagellar capping protein FliD